MERRMMKVTAFVGSPRKKHTYNAAESFLQKLQALGNVEYEIVRLDDYHLETCKGCQLCTNRGEELCPLKDDRDKLIDKMIGSDGVVFATPNYMFHVTASMKRYLERLSFYGHRPRFFGKAFTSIVAQGFYGGKDILKYFGFVGKRLGFNVVKGAVITTLEPMTDKGQMQIDKIIDKQSKKFYSVLVRKEYPSPTLFDLMIFRMTRTSARLLIDESYRDHTYYKEKGWFESGYYYPVRLGPFKTLAGKVLDMIAVRMTKSR